jgi:7-carboxy-7-deazaguanine synthase
MEVISQNDQVKFVVGDQEDYHFCKKTIKDFNLQEKCTILISPVFGRIDHDKLAGWILEDKLPVRFQLQMHKYIWEPATRGV